MYNKVDTNMNFVEREKKTEQFWRENNIFRKSMENRKEGETYTFYDRNLLQQTESLTSDMLRHVP